MNKFIIFTATSAVALAAACAPDADTQAATDTAAPADSAAPAPEAPASDGVNVNVPAGFTASVYHPGIGASARHIAVRDNGDLLVAIRTGELVALRDTDGDGDADEIARREAPVTNGMHIWNGYLYFADDVSVSRVALDDGLMPSGEIETVVSGFERQRSHATKTLAFDNDGVMYVSVGAPSNTCQESRRTPGSPGQTPCPQLETTGGVWTFDPNTLDQTQADGERFATGVRNAVAMEWSEPAGDLFMTIHGRDQLDDLWPEHFSVEQRVELPAEEFHVVREGSDMGWPYTYYDPMKNARKMSPEYGGDGEQAPEAGVYQEPLFGFAAHMAPNDMVFYGADSFPAEYWGGAFIAFHGSWNRAPEPQKGFKVMFAPMNGSELLSEPVDFVTGFDNGGVASPGDAAARPSGLAVGIDGALYVTETVNGTIWRIAYTGE